MTYRAIKPWKCPELLLIILLSSSLVGCNLLNPPTPPTPPPPIPNISIAQQEFTFDESAGYATLPVILDKSTTNTVRVNYKTVEGSAEEDIDFTPTTGTLTYNPNQTQNHIQVPIIDNDIYAGLQNFSIELSNPQNATLQNNRAIVNITENDPIPRVSFEQDNYTLGIGTHNIPLSLSNRSKHSIYVSISSDDITASSDNYSSIDEVVEFPPLQVNNSITADITGNYTLEDYLSFAINLSSPENASIDPANSSTTISIPREQMTNPPRISIPSTGYLAYEDSGSINIPIRIQFPVNNFTSSIDYFTIDDTAIAGENYEHVEGTLNFTGDTTTKNITIPILDNNFYSGGGEFYLKIQNPVNGFITRDNAVIIVLENDPPPTLSILGCYNADNFPTTIDLLLQLTNPSARDIYVDFTTSDGTALSNIHYKHASGTIKIPRLTSEQTIPLEIIANDSGDLGYFNVTLDNIESEITANLGTSSSQINISDIPLPQVELSMTHDNYFENEWRDMIISPFISLSRAPCQEIIYVDVSTQDGTGLDISNRPAIANTDYHPLNDTLMITGHNTTKHIPIEIIDDDTFDYRLRDFTVSISNPQNATINTNNDTTRVFIFDDDPAPTIALSSPYYDMTNNNVIIPISLSNPSVEDIILNYNTSNGTATANTDYYPMQGTITIPAHATNATLSLKATTSGQGYFNLTLDEILEGTANLGLSSAQVNITPQVIPPTINIEKDAHTVHGRVAGERTINLNVSISPPPQTTSHVSYNTVPITAEEDINYAPIEGTLTFTPTTTEHTLTIETSRSQYHEDYKSLKLLLSNPQNAKLGRTKTFINLKNTSSVPGMGFTDGNYFVPDTMTSFSISVLSSVSARTTSVEYYTQDGSAISNIDYVPSQGLLTFNPLQARANIPLQILPQNNPNGYYTINLRNPVFAYILTHSATLHIVPSSKSNPNYSYELSPLENTATPDDVKNSFGYNTSLLPPSHVPIINYAPNDTPLFPFIGQKIGDRWLVDITPNGKVIPAITGISPEEFHPANWPKERYQHAVADLVSGASPSETLFGDMAGTLLTGGYYVAGDTVFLEPVTVAPGTLLVLGPDVSVTFAAGVNAVGTAQHPVIWTSAAAAPAPGAWGGVSAWGDTVFQYQLLEDVTAGLTVHDAGARVTDTVIRHKVLPDAANSGDTLLNYVASGQATRWKHQHP